MNQQEWDELQVANALRWFLQHGVRNLPGGGPAPIRRQIEEIGRRVQSLTASAGGMNHVCDMCRNSPDRMIELVVPPHETFNAKCPLCGRRYYYNGWSNRVRNWFDPQLYVEGQRTNIQLQRSSWIRSLDGTWGKGKRGPLAPESIGLSEAMLFGADENYLIEHIPWSLIDLWMVSKSPGGFWHSDIKDRVVWKKQSRW